MWGGASRPDSSFGIFLKSDIFRVSVGYPTIMEKQKKPRESTDLAEYIFLGTNNFSQLQIVKKLELCKVGRISENLRKSQALMRQNPRIFRFCVKLYISVHQNLDFFEKTRRFVLIVSPKLYRVRTSP